MSGGGGPIDFARLYQRLDEAERALERDFGEDFESRRRALIERAMALADAREHVRPEAIDVLAFSVGGRRFAARIASVEQVVEPKGLSMLPGVPPHVLGAMVVRSKVVVVFDLRQLLGLGRAAVDLGLVVVLSNGDDRFGVAAESVEGRTDIPLEGADRAVSGPFELVSAGGVALFDVEALSRLAAEAE